MQPTEQDGEIFLLVIDETYGGDEGTYAEVNATALVFRVSLALTSRKRILAQDSIYRHSSPF